MFGGKSRVGNVVQAKDRNVWRGVAATWQLSFANEQR